MSNTSSKVAREWPAAAADDELRLHLEFLAFLRATAVNKLAGLSRSSAVSAPLPGSPRLTALGVVKHLTAVERWWLSIEAGGSALPSLWAGSPDPSWDLSAADTPASVVAAYQEEWARSAASLAGLSPGEPTRRGGGFTVRWVLEHVVQETARHVGHLDLLREMADGEVGE